MSGPSESNANGSSKPPHGGAPRVRDGGRYRAATGLPVPNTPYYYCGCAKKMSPPKGQWQAGGAPGPGWPALVRPGRAGQAHFARRPGRSDPAEGIVMTKAYGLYLGCWRAPIKHRIGSWIQTSRRRHGVEPNGSVPLWKRRGVARLAPDLKVRCQAASGSWPARPGRHPPSRAKDRPAMAADRGLHVTVRVTTTSSAS